MEKQRIALAVFSIISGLMFIHILGIEGLRCQIMDGDGVMPFWMIVLGSCLIIVGVLIFLGVL
jgi:hypothetical protein